MYKPRDNWDYPLSPNGHIWAGIGLLVAAAGIAAESNGFQETISALLCALLAGAGAASLLIGAVAFGQLLGQHEERQRRAGNGPGARQSG